MNIKYFFFIFMPLFFNISLVAQPFPMNNAAFDQEPSLEDLDKMVKELTLDTFRMQKGRDPENEQELKEFEEDLQKMGEQIIEGIIEEGKKEGKTEAEALDSFFADLFGSLPGLEEVEEKEVPAEEVALPAKPIVPAQEVHNVQDILEQLVDAIANFRMKAASIKIMHDALIPYKYRLDDLTYLLHVLNNEQLISKYLADPAFVPFVQQLKEFHKALVSLEEEFQPTSGQMEEQTPYEILDILISAEPEEIIAAYQQKIKELNPTLLRKKLEAQHFNTEAIQQALEDNEHAIAQINQAYIQLHNQEEAKYLFEAILQTIDKAVEQDKIIDQIKALLEKYKQDAAAQIKEREKVEAEAREAHKKAMQMRPLLFPAVEKKFTWPKPAEDQFRWPSFENSSTGIPESFKKPAIGKPKPSAPSKKPGEKKKPNGKKEGEKKPADKGKEKDKDKTKGEKKPSIDKDVQRELTIINDHIDQAYRTIAKNVGKLKIFVLGLGHPINIEQAKEMQGMLTEITRHFNDAKNRLEKAFGDKKDKKEALQKEVKKSLEKLQNKLEGNFSAEDKEKLEKDKININDFKKADLLINKLILNAANAFRTEGDQFITVNPDQLYAFFGKATAPVSPEVQSLNKPDEEGKATNFVDLLQKSYESLKKAAGIKK